jgi:hypothetical protein
MDKISGRRPIRISNNENDNKKLMSTEVDHVFICTAVGAPGAERLRKFGLTEGPPNQHPGQGTACRRFFFRNAMLELLWVEDAADARSDQTRRTKLWERWSESGSSASPFGIILRPAAGTPTACPFPSWEYRPASMPDLKLHVATDTGLGEPMWCYLDPARTPVPSERRQPLEHPPGFGEITSVYVTGPPLSDTSVTLAMARAGIIRSHVGKEHLVELLFDGEHHTNRMDFRPDLPLVFRW